MGAGVMELTSFICETVSVKSLLLPFLNFLNIYKGLSKECSCPRQAVLCNVQLNFVAGVILYTDLVT